MANKKKIIFLGGSVMIIKIYSILGVFHCNTLEDLQLEITGLKIAELKMHCSR